uniref:hypothetical protein n=1 Tax=Micromonospora acroterricola TaxID=2202421 RepID=UPI0011B4F674|nr:hypothetical protein [Micromonospora acroterricola]
MLDEVGCLDPDLHRCVWSSQTRKALAASAMALAALVAAVPNPATTGRAYIEVTGAGHNYIGQPSTILARTMIPWLKIFVDDGAVALPPSTIPERRPPSRQRRGHRELAHRDQHARRSWNLFDLEVRESVRWCAE